MYIKNIRLDQAFSKNISANFFIWYVNGSHIGEVHVPRNACVNLTFVTKLPENRIQVGVEWTTTEALGAFHHTISEFSSLEELKQCYPKLLELDGLLCAFS